MNKFVEIEHAADIALKVRGKNLPELFLNALEGLYFLIFETEINIQRENSANKINELFSAPSREELLIDWLSEGLYRVLIDNEIVESCSKLAIETDEYVFKLYGDIQMLKLNSLKMKPVNEIKAVTYHNLEIQKDENGYS
ncbi:MAG: archease, partial [Calditrichia bacterium]|nr:archease [Calditrichia bacterium]